MPAEQSFTQEFLAFRLGQQDYGLSILDVQEIRTPETPTQLPQTGAYALGVINLRGRIVPIFDLHALLGLKQHEKARAPVHIICHHGNGLLGLQADEVLSVVALSPAEIKPLPDIFCGGGKQHIHAMASVAARNMLLVTIDELLDQTRIDAELLCETQAA